MKTFDASTVGSILAAGRCLHKTPYYAFYSSLWDAVTFDPSLMVVPFDDHLVHRGDGVFESFKCLNGAAYNLDAHLLRLRRSSAAMGLVIPHGLDFLREKVLEVLSMAKQPDCSVRVIISRGPGGMGVNPQESSGSVIYIMIYGLGTPFMQQHPQGAKLGKSEIPVKPSLFATAKTCNYMNNVLMKMEANGKGVDFMVGVDENFCITEGAVENVGIVSNGNRLVFPPLDNILAGTTMLRVMELAGDLERRGVISGIESRPIFESELRDVREILIVGTTLNVVSVVEYDGKSVGAGQPGTIASELNGLLEADILENTALRARYM